MAVQHVAHRKDGQSREEAHPGDFYETPQDVIKGQITLSYVAMLHYGASDYMRSTLRVLDPCVGSGAYGYGLRDFFLDARIQGIELNPRPMSKGWDPYDWVDHADFMTWSSHGDKFDFAIFNPPYSDANNQPLAHRFILKALEHVKPGGVVSALVKAEFWNGKSRFNQLFANKKRPVYIVPSVSRISFDGTGKTSTQDYSIGVWVKGVDRRPEVLWLDWKDGVSVYG